MTTTDQYATVFWGEGYGITPDFLNNGQRFVQAQLTDQLLQYTIAGLEIAATDPAVVSQNGTDAPLLYAYCISPGSAHLRQGSANHKIQIAPGTLLHKIANSDGLGSTLVPYTFAGTEEFTLTAGDGTNPRVDLLQMKLEYITDTPASIDFQDAVSRVLTTNPLLVTKRRIRCTLSVKAGTPAASPVIPDPDSGFVPVGTVVVGHTWAIAGNLPIFGIDTADTAQLVVHDQRMPLGVDAHRVDPLLYKQEDGWSLLRTNTAAVATSGTNKMFAMCPIKTGRVIGVDVFSDGLTVGAATIGAFFSPSGAGPSSGYKRGNTLVTSGAGGSVVQFRSVREQFEGAHNPLAGPTIQKSAVNKIGVPMWTSGRRTPNREGTIPSQESCSLGFVNQADVTVIYETVFYVAGGI